MIPFWLAGEWLGEWLPRWQKAEREAALYLGISFPGWWG